MVEVAELIRLPQAEPPRDALAEAGTVHSNPCRCAWRSIGAVRQSLPWQWLPAAIPGGRSRQRRRRAVAGTAGRAAPFRRAASAAPSPAFDRRQRRLPAAVRFRLGRALAAARFLAAISRSSGVPPGRPCRITEPRRRRRRHPAGPAPAGAAEAGRRRRRRAGPNPAIGAADDGAVAAGARGRRSWSVGRGAGMVAAELADPAGDGGLLRPEPRQRRLSGMAPRGRAEGAAIRR